MDRKFVISLCDALKANRSVKQVVLKRCVVSIVEPFEELMKHRNIDYVSELGERFSINRFESEETLVQPENTLGERVSPISMAFFNPCSNTTTVVLRLCSFTIVTGDSQDVRFQHSVVKKFASRFLRTEGIQLINIHQQRDLPSPFRSPRASQLFAVSFAFSNIKHIQLDGLKLNETDIIQFCSRLSEQNSVEILQLSENSIMAAGGLVLARLLQTQHRLTYLVLQGNSLKAPEMKQILASGLKNVHQAMLEVDLRRNGYQATFVACYLGISEMQLGIKVTF